MDKVTMYLNEIYKQAGVEYGFTAYKDKDGKIEKTMRDHMKATKDKDEDKADELFFDFAEKGKSDYKFPHKFSNKGLAWSQVQTVDPVDHVLKKSKGYKFTMSDSYSDDNGVIITDERGAIDMSKHVDSIIKKLESSSKVSASQIAKLTQEIANGHSEIAKLKWYNFLKRNKLNQHIAHINSKVLALKESAPEDWEQDNFRGWKKNIDSSLKDNNNLYQWEWY